MAAGQAQVKKSLKQDMDSEWVDVPEEEWRSVDTQPLSAEPAQKSLKADMESDWVDVPEEQWRDLPPAGKKLKEEMAKEPGFLTQIGGRLVDMGKGMYQAWKKGDLEAMTGLKALKEQYDPENVPSYWKDPTGYLAHMIPFVGPSIDRATKLGFHKPGEASAILATDVLLPAAIPTASRSAFGKLGSIAEGLQKPIIKSRLNPVEQSAANYLKSEGVSLPASVQTGNKFTEALEAVVARSPLGSGRAIDFGKATEQGLTDVAKRLANEIYPDDVSYYQAGSGVQKRLENKISNLKQQSDTLYSKFREIESLPENLKRIELQPRTEPLQLPEFVMVEGKKMRLADFSPEQRAAMGYPDPGNLPARSLPIEMEKFRNSEGMPSYQMQNAVAASEIAMPVDMRPIKAALLPIFQHWSQWIQPAARNASQGYTAMKSIIAGDNFVPASVAEAGLSGLKSLAREAKSPDLANASQGIGKFSTAILQDQIDKAVGMAERGSEALTALRAGRMKHAQKMGIDQVLSQIRKEPVQALQQMVFRKDSGINLLKSINKLAPDEMPRIGRAYLDEVIQSATSKGGFKNAASLLNTWESLGPQTKSLIFQNKKLIENLNNLFIGAKNASIKANSWTEMVRQATSLNPIRWGAGYAGGKLLFTNKGINKLMSPPFPRSGRIFRSLANDMATQKRLKSIPPAAAAAENERISRLRRDMMNQR